MKHWTNAILRRGCASLLALCMLLALLPAGALAGEAGDAPADEYDEDLPACTCGASEGEAHDGDCPLYKAVCAVCGAEHETAACPVTAAAEKIAALPEPPAVSAAMAADEAAFDPAQLDLWAAQAQAATDAYDALTPEQQALLPEAQETFDALLAAFRGEAATLAAIVKIPADGQGWADVAKNAEAGVDYSIDETTDAITIYTACGLAWLNEYSETAYCVVLNNDIDLGLHPWTPIEAGKSLHSFDGQGHTISGLYCEGGRVAGLFGAIGTTTSEDDPATIRDLRVTGSTLSATANPGGATYAGGLVAYLKSSGTGRLVVQNCSVELNAVTATGPDTGSAQYASAGGLLGTAFLDQQFSERFELVNCFAKVGRVEAVSDSHVGDADAGTRAETVAAAGGLVGSVKQTDYSGAYLGITNSGAAIGTVEAKSYYNDAFSGGLVGGMECDKSSLTNCYVSAGGISAASSHGGEENSSRACAVVGSGAPNQKILQAYYCVSSKPDLPAYERGLGAEQKYENVLPYDSDKHTLEASLTIHGLTCTTPTEALNAWVEQQESEEYAYWVDETGSPVRAVVTNEMWRAVQYTVSFETGAGSAVEAKKVQKYHTLDMPEAPTQTGHIFLGWFTDEALTKPYDPSHRVTEDFTLYAKWQEAATWSEAAESAKEGTDYTIEGNVIHIKNSVGLAWLAKQANSNTTYNNTNYSAVLDADVDIGAMAWVPIGNASSSSDPYTLSGFDGQGHTISGLRVEPNENAGGLFGAVNKTVIQNLTVTGSTVEGKTYAGGLVGDVLGVTTIRNCTVRLTDVSANSSTSAIYAGGLVGCVDEATTIEACHVSIDNVTATAGKRGAYAGGLAGGEYNYPTVTVKGCTVTATGKIAAASNAYATAGGLLGGKLGKNVSDKGMTLTAEDCTVTAASLTAKVSDADSSYGGNNAAAGGLAGFLYQLQGAANCTVTIGGEVSAQVTGGDCVGFAAAGGLLGYCTGDAASSPTGISGCTAQVGSVSAQSAVTSYAAPTYAGGLAGFYKSTAPLTNCRATVTGDVAAAPTPGVEGVRNDSCAGGLLGTSGKVVTSITTTTTMTGCQAQIGGKVTATAAGGSYSAFAGGLAGYANLTATDCLAQAGSIASSSGNDAADMYTCAGGLLGYGIPNLSGCGARTGPVTATRSGSSGYACVGGLAAFVEDNSKSSMSMKNSYAAVSGALSATGGGVAYAGGLAGRMMCPTDVANCYARMDSLTAASAKGGLVGYLYSGYANQWRNGYFYDPAGATKSAFGNYTPGTDQNNTSYKADGVLTTAISEGGQTYTDLTDALNAWVNAQKDASYRRWTASSQDGTASAIAPIHGDLWAPPQYTVIFDTAGGTKVDPQQVTEGQPAAKPSGEPLREGYTFAGWFDAETDGTAWNFATAITGDTTIYACWTPNTYTVSYDANYAGALTISTTTTVTFGEAYGLTFVMPTRPGYTCEGWYFAPEGGTAITGNTTVSTASDHTVYAHWVPNGYTVAFDGGGSTGGSMAPQPFTYGVPGALSANGFTRQYTVTFSAGAGTVSPASAVAKYAFAGWAKTAGGEWAYTDQQTVQDLTLTANETVTLYALWTPASVALPTPSRPNHTFAGWYTGEGGAGTRVEGEDYTPSGNLTLYADWTAKPSLSPDELVYDLEAGGTYDGTAKGVVVTTKGEGLGAVTVTYYKDDGYTEQIEVPTDAGIYYIKVVVAESADYAETEFELGPWVIGKATPTTVTVPRASAIIYGQSLSDSALSGGAADVEGTFTWADAALRPAVSDSGETEYTVKFTPTDATNYEWITCAVKLTVNRATLTVSARADGKTYDGTTAAAGVINLTGAVGGENPTATAVFAFADADAGENKTVHVTGITLGELWRANYSLSAATASATATITARAYNAGEMTVAPIEDLPYTGQAAQPVPAITYNGQPLKEGTDFTCAYENNTEIGTGKVTITFKGNFSGQTSETFEIIDAQLPSGTTNDDIFVLSGAELMKWHNEDLTLTAKGGWTVGFAADVLSGSVTLSDESAKVDEKIVPSSAELYVQDKDRNLYRTTVEYLLDKTPPTITVDGETSGEVVGTWGASREITFTVTDNLSGIIYVSHSGNRSGNNDIIEPELRDDGTYTFTALVSDSYTIMATDGAENIASHGFITQQLDGLKPTAVFGGITGIQGENGWFTGDVTVSISVEDPETTPNLENTPINESDKSGIKNWEYSLDGGTSWTTGSENSFTITENGDYTDKLQLRATDNAGNVSEITTASAKRDAATPAKPTVTATVDGQPYGGGFTAKPVTLTATANGTVTSGVTLQYKLESGEWVDAATVIHSTNTPDGGVVYAFRAISGAGTASSEVTQTVKYRALDDEVKNDPANKYGESDFSIDGTGLKDGWYTADVTVAVTKKETIADSTTSYPADTWYQLDDGGKTKLDGNSIAITGDGEHTLEIWTEDASGNETTHWTAAVRIDKTKPTIADVASNPAEWTKENAQITFTAADATSGVASVTVVRDGTADYAVTNNGSFTTDQNGSYVITVTDRAGNATTETVAVTKIDKTAPVVVWNDATAALDPGKWYGKTALIATATDDSGETPDITLTASGIPYHNGDVIGITGSYIFQATAKDGAGNVGSSPKLTVRIETAIDEFVAKVDGLSSGSDYQDILDVVNWYNSQSQTVQDRFSKSDDAKAAYETLMGLLQNKAKEAAAGVADAIQKANTIDKIEQAQKDYDALPDRAKEQVADEVKAELEQKKADVDAARKVIEQLDYANRGEASGEASDSYGSYEEKQAALEAYEKLTDGQKVLVNQVDAAWTDKDTIEQNLRSIELFLADLEKIQRPFTPDTKAAIKNLGDLYSTFTADQKVINAIPQAAKDRLAELEAMRGRAQAVENNIKALGDPASQAELNTVQGAYNALTADEKAMVDGALKTELDQKYQDMIDQLDADEKAAAEFAAKVEEVKNAPTVDKIEQLIKDHDALSDAAKEKLTDQTKQDYEKLVGDLDKAKDVIGKLDGLDPENLTPDDMDDVKDALDGYGKLDDNQQKLVDEATGGKADILDEAVKGAKDATDKIEDIPSHPDGTDIGSNCPGYNDPGDPTGENHNYEQHRKAIEEAKIAYERLTDAGRKLISDDAKEKLNREYAALMAYLEYVNTAKTASTTVEVAGLAEKVELPPESASAGKTVISVEMKDEKPAVMPPLPAGKREALSVDIKLVASIYDNAGDAAPAATETVQPKSGEQVLVKLLLPTGYELDTLEIWHVKENGGRSRIQDFWLVTEDGGVCAVFEVRSFSHFVFFAEKTSAGGGTVTPPAPKPDIPGTDHGTTTVRPRQPRPGTNVTVSPKPDEGYVVDKVIVTDQGGKELPVKDNGDGSWSYTQPKGKVTVTVTFKPAPKDPQLPFADVTENDWFYESVKYVCGKGLMLGTSDTTFSPGLGTSRGMIVTILWRLESSPEAAKAADFTDVAPDQYYTGAVAWGVENGIVKGYGNGSFGPNDLITREQLAAILYRYAQYRGCDATQGGMALREYADYGDISDWALPAMRWANAAGLISGRSNSRIAPRGTATRAETATILMRFSERAK